MASTSTMTDDGASSTSPTHPLVLSLLAGLSTCLGASVVFFANGGAAGNKGAPSSNTNGVGKKIPANDGPDSNPQQQQQEQESALPAGRGALGPKHMSFSLALAGSVMVTVSFYSLLPESFTMDNDAERVQVLPINSRQFWERVVSFVAGCGLYWLLSKCAFPEPDEILGLDADLNKPEDCTTLLDDSMNSNSSSGRNDNANPNEDEGNITSDVVAAEDDVEMAPTATPRRQDHPDKDVAATVSFSSTKEADVRTKTKPGRNNFLFRRQLSSPPERTSPPNNNKLSSNSGRDTSQKQNDGMVTLGGGSSSGDVLALSDRSDKPSDALDRLVPYTSGKDKDRRINRNYCCCGTTTATTESSTGGGSGGGRGRHLSFTGADLATPEARRAWRVTMLLFVSLAVHNFPEGFAVAASSIHSPKLGLTTALAIALHNIPEGIAIAVPCLAARPDSPWLAFGLASLSGLAEPLGAFVALLVLDQVHHQSGSGGKGSSDEESISTKGVLSFVAGVMVMVAVNELFPEAARHTQEGRLPLVLGILAGVIIMIASDSYLES